MKGQNAKANLPKMFHSQSDKNAEIARIERLLKGFRANPKVKSKVIRLAESRLRTVRGLQVRT